MGRGRRPVAPPPPIAGWGDAPAEAEPLPPLPEPTIGPEVDDARDGDEVMADPAEDVQAEGASDWPEAPVSLGEVERLELGSGAGTTGGGGRRGGEDEGGGAKVRLQRFMADRGVAARRACEAMIEAGRVEVNGKVERTLPIFVDPSRDRVVVDGRVLARAKATGGQAGSGRGGTMAERLVYILVHKPERVLSATSDPGGRATVLDLVQHPAIRRGGLTEGEGGSAVRVYPVGRLEYDARGLVLLTNDGDVANRLTHPRYGVRRVYEAMVRGLYPVEQLADLARGINAKASRLAWEAGKRAGTIELAIAGVRQPDQRQRRSVREAVRNDLMASRGNDESPKTVLRVTLTGPLHVPMADLFAEAGVRITRLTLVAVGPLHLADVRPGEWRELSRHEVVALRRLGEKQDRGVRGGVGGGVGGGGGGGVGGGPKKTAP